MATFEMLIAMGLIVLLLSSILPLLASNQSILVGSQTSQEALYKAKELLEEARVLALLSFESVKTTSLLKEDIYTKNIEVEDIDPYIKKVTSNVTWDITGKNQYVSLSALLTKVESGQDTCAQQLSGNWQNPILLGSADIGDNNEGSDVDVYSKKAYLTANSPSISKRDFYIFDVSNPNALNLPVLGSVETGPGLAAVQVAGKYAYVANTGTTSQLQVIDISTPSNPALVSYLDLTAQGDGAVGNSIFYQNGKVYLGLTKSSLGPEFWVIDVSNPLSPVALASYPVNTKVNSITVKNGVAFLAVPDNGGTLSQEQLITLDVSAADQKIIGQLGSFGPNTITMSGQALYLSKNTNNLYLGEGGANPAKKPQFFSLNYSNPGNITSTAEKYIETSPDITANAIIVRENLAFLGVFDSDVGFFQLQVWDLNNLESASPYSAINIQKPGRNGLDCEGNLMYVAQENKKALQIIGTIE